MCVFVEWSVKTSGIILLLKNNFCMLMNFNENNGPKKMTLVKESSNEHNELVSVNLGLKIKKLKKKDREFLSNFSF